MIWNRRIANFSLQMSAAVLFSQCLWAQAPQNAALAGVENAGPATTANPFTAAADVQEGNALFLRHCSYCHGAQGEGGRGADLTAGIYRHGSSDADLFRTIRGGVPGTEMPAVRASDTEIWKMVAFVRKLGSSGMAEHAAGDAKAGSAVYDRGGCANCHRIGNVGKDVGPELTSVGRRRGLAFLSESIVKPEADVPNAYRATQVVLKSSTPVTGVRLNEDDLSIQLRDTAGELRSFLKTDVKEIRRTQPAIMPAYTSLSKQDLENLVAFLSSLKGDE
jgi:putative heme-binding domain-containing protein